jgi:hypothetical protein
VGAVTQEFAEAFARAAAVNANNVTPLPFTSLLLAVDPGREWSRI